MRSAATVKCPSLSFRSASAPGICSASHRPWAGAMKRSWAPCQTLTGTVIDAGSKPHGL